MTECQARIVESPWYVHWHRCGRNASHMFHGIHLCGTHLRVVERWAATRTEDQLFHMVEFHWRLKMVKP